MSNESNGIRDVYLSISDFAGLAGVTRDALLHYDRIGLLSPVARGENNYRYYSYGQTDIVYLIRTLLDLGLSLSEIMRVKELRTPANTSDLLSKQIGHIDENIEHWLEVKKLLLTLKSVIDTALIIDEKIMSVQFMPAEAVVLGNLNDYNGGKNEYDARRSFLSKVRTRYPRMNLNYPVWAIFSEDRIRAHDWVWPDRYYLYNPDGEDRKAAGYYAIGYARGVYGNNNALYERLLCYIDDNGFEICGNTYEEYPLNEFCISVEDNYLQRIMINVKKRSNSNIL